MFSVGRPLQIAGDSEVSEVVGFLKRSLCRFRASSPSVLDAFVAAVLIQISRVGRSSFLDSFDDFFLEAGEIVYASWIQSVSVLTGKKSIGERVVFVEFEGRVFAFEIACFVVLNAVSKDEVLASCGGANRVGLHES